MPLTPYASSGQNSTLLDVAKSHILVADDDPMTFPRLKEAIEREGYMATFVRDGGTALRMAQTLAPDLIVLNPNLSAASGLSVFKELRAAMLTRRIPVIFITGGSSRDAVVRGAARVAYLKKPLDVESFKSLASLFLESYPRR